MDSSEKSFSDFKKELWQYLEDNNYIETETLSTISECKMGISGLAFKSWLSSLCTPISVYYGIQDISSLLKKIKETLASYEIQPTIVLEGLPYHLKIEEEVRDKLRELETFKSEENLPSFKEISDDFLFNVLNDNGFEVIFAPYSASAQLKYMYANDFIHCVFDNLDFLVYCQEYPTFSNLITSIDLSDESFQFFGIKSFMMKTPIKKKIWHPLFVLGGILEGKCLIKDEEMPFSRICKYFKNEEELKDLLTEESQKKYNAHLKVFENMLILNSNGEIDSLSGSEPNIDEVSKIFGNSLPNEFFYFLMNGIISKSFATCLMRNCIHTIPQFPESLELRKSMEKMLNEDFPMTISWLTRSLCPSSFHCSFEVKRHYLQEKSKILDHKHHSAEAVEIPYFQKSRRQGNLGAIAFSKIFIQQYLTDSKSPKRHRLFSLDSDFEEPKSDSGPDTLSQILANAYKFFFSMGKYIDKEEEPTIHLSAMRKCEVLYEEELVLLLEILKSEACHLFEAPFCSVKNLKRLPVTKSELENLQNLSKGLLRFEPKRNPQHFEGVKDSEAKYIFCISRVFSFIPSNLINIDQKFDEHDIDCAKFRAVIETFQRKCRNQFESVVWYLFTSGHYTNFPNYLQAFRSVSNAKPFKKGVNVSLGAAVKLFLQGKLKIESESLKTSFKHGFRLWKNLIYILEYQEKKIGKKNPQNKIFEEADLFLHQKFKVANII